MLPFWADTVWQVKKLSFFLLILMDVSGGEPDHHRQDEGFSSSCRVTGVSSLNSTPRAAGARGFLCYQVVDCSSSVFHWVNRVKRHFLADFMLCGAALLGACYHWLWLWALPEAHCGRLAGKRVGL